MNIIDEFEIYQREEKHAGFSPILEMATKKTGKTMESPVASFCPIIDQYEMRLVLGIRFYANKVQYDSALQDAKSALLGRIYGCVYQAIKEAHLAIESQDAMRAHLALQRIQNEIGL